MCSLPHARGGVSDGKIPFIRMDRSSPRPWGCFLLDCTRNRAKDLFPTPVGVFLCIMCAGVAAGSLPHARGGVSRHGRTRKGLCNSSPRPWGCFYPSMYPLARNPLFPTHVGVFPQDPPSALLPRSLPHARGGVSRMQQAYIVEADSSPRTWGCFPSGALRANL